MNAVARALRLDYYALKRRVSGLPVSPTTRVSPSFVEVCLGEAGAASGGTVELEDGTGRKMKVTVAHGAGLDVAALTTAFWEACE